MLTSYFENHFLKKISKEKKGWMVVGDKEGVFIEPPN
jgi:hypothetical protein